MLSKSQAKTFFVGGTVLFSCLFLFLTMDTIRQVPKLTKQQNLTDAVKRGKLLWDVNNCMGCHTLMGEGAYYAPELTKVYERRGPVWMKTFMKNPQAMFPNARKMVQYKFSEQNLDDLVAFFKWIGEIDLQGFPPKPSKSLEASLPAKASVSGISGSSVAPTIFKQLCVACHAVGGAGGNVGPALDGVGKKFDAAYLKKWLVDPQKVKPGSQMPKLPLSQVDVKNIVQYLLTLK